MNLSLKNRITISFITANIAVLTLVFLIFHYLDSLNRKVDDIIEKSAQTSSFIDQARISVVSILKYQRELQRELQKELQSSKELSDETIERINKICDDFIYELKELETPYSGSKAGVFITEMRTHVESLKVGFKNNEIKTVDELTDKLLNSFTRFQKMPRNQRSEQDRLIKDTIQETKKRMLMVLVIGFLATIILALVVPGKIALPFKKIKDAIRELRDCNFDVLIYYSQNDEIGEIAEEMNKMIHAFKVFDELRADRISVENRKFDALANMVKRSVLLVNAEGQLIYMNNRLYSLLQVQSEDVIGKDIGSTPGIPSSIAEACSLAIKRRSKVENRKITILAKPDDDEENKLKEEGGSEQETKNQEESKDPKIIFEGHATILPIRGKESSRDYYLMIISKDLLS